jgi:protein tyrosine phosphatase
MTKREDIELKLSRLRTVEQAKEAYESAPRSIKHYYLRRWHDLSLAEINRARSLYEVEIAFRRSPAEVSTRCLTEFESIVHSKVNKIKKKKK